MEMKHKIRVKAHVRRIGRKRIPVKRHTKRVKKNYAMGFEHIYSFSDVSHKDIKTVKMEPEEFLRKTFEEAQLNQIRSGHSPMVSFEEYKKNVLLPKHVKFLKKELEKDKEIPIPFLEFDKWGRPIGHEGRHTSAAAGELGMKTIPVTIEKRRYPREWESAPPKGVVYYLDIDSYEGYPEQAVAKEFVYKGKKK